MVTFSIPLWSRSLQKIAIVSFFPGMFPLSHRVFVLISYHSSTSRIRNIMTVCSSDIIISFYMQRVSVARVCIISPLRIEWHKSIVHQNRDSPSIIIVSIWFSIVQVSVDSTPNVEGDISQRFLLEFTLNMVSVCIRQNSCHDLLHLGF